MQSKRVLTCHKRHQKSHFKCTATFHKGHQKRPFVKKVTGNMPRPRLRLERGDTFCASLRHRNAFQHFTRGIRRTTLYGNLLVKCRRPEWAQNADTYFARACAVKTHVKISQEPLCTEIYWKNAAPKNADTHFASLRSRNACQDLTRATLCRNLQEKRRTAEWAPWSSIGL